MYTGPTGGGGQPPYYYTPATSRETGAMESRNVTTSSSDSRGIEMSTSDARFNSSLLNRIVSNFPLYQDEVDYAENRTTFNRLMVRVHNECNNGLRDPLMLKAYRDFIESIMNHSFNVQVYILKARLHTPDAVISQFGIDRTPNATYSVERARVIFNNLLEALACLRRGSQYQQCVEEFMTALLSRNITICRGLISCRDLDFRISLREEVTMWMKMLQSMELCPPRTDIDTESVGRVIRAVWSEYADLMNDSRDLCASSADTNSALNHANGNR